MPGPFQASRKSIDAGLVQPPRFLGQHDRNAVADRVGELRGARDQLLTLAVIFERALGERADQDFEQFRVDAAGGAFRRIHKDSGARARKKSCANEQTIARLRRATATWSRPRCSSWRARSRSAR